jgi:hypothetical protein
MNWYQTFYAATWVFHLGFAAGCEEWLCLSVSEPQNFRLRLSSGP